MLEFLLNNWFFILIVLITFIFQKMGNARKDAEKQNPRPIRTGGYGEQNHHPTSLETDDSMEREALHREPLGAEDDQTFSHTAPPNATSDTPMSRHDSIYRNSMNSSRETSAPSRSSQQATRGEFVSLNKAAQGMMWAEIFGKPRSLNPHRSQQKGRRN
jgi:hypothetical protein